MLQILRILRLRSYIRKTYMKRALTYFAFILLLASSTSAHAFTLSQSAAVRRNICIIAETNRCYQQILGFAHNACGCGPISSAPFFSVSDSYYQSCSRGLTLNCSYAIIAIALNGSYATYDQCLAQIPNRCM